MPQAVGRVLSATAFASLIIAAAALTGCGYAGEPLPPALRRPVRVTDLQAVERGGSIAVRFTVPAKTTEDLAIKGTPDIELRIGPAADSGFDPDNWARDAERITPISQDGFTATALIPIGRYIGKAVVVGVNVRGPQGRTAGWSNFVALSIVPALDRPAGLSASDANDAVALEWHAAAGQFRVFRRTAGSAAWDQTAEPLKPEFTDEEIEYGKTYQYYVESIRKAGDSVAVSEPSDVITFKPVDRFAPAIPSGLAAVPGGKGIELVWDRNAEKDFAGYRLYRDGTRLGADLSAPSYSDQAVQPGTPHSYQITAFDANGNESARSAPAAVIAP